MKFAAFLITALLALSSCAPMAILVDESGQSAAPAVAANTEEPSDPNELPNFKPNDGLLNPSGLSTMPTANDMKSTVGPVDGSQSTVIATPPEKEEATSE
ncbi:hypothetical protein [Haloferula sp.]|uniref:hypothetical protein n=1 Tax=Haloferula sp. TaxID=2497595 RepID=UPI00329C4CD5